MAGSARKVSRGVRFMRHLRPDQALQVAPGAPRARPRLVVERGQVDDGRAQVGRGVDRGHGHHAETLVGVGQPLELLGQHLPQHLVDPQRARE